jgi:hypothetical protein
MPIMIAPTAMQKAAHPEGTHCFVIVVVHILLLQYRKTCKLKQIMQFFWQENTLLLERHQQLTQSWFDLLRKRFCYIHDNCNFILH